MYHGSSEIRQQEMGGRVPRDDLFSSRKASKRMDGRATRQSPSSFLHLDYVDGVRKLADSLSTIMASRASKFDSKEAVPRAKDTTRLRKFFWSDSRGELRLGPAQAGSRLT